MLLTGHKCMGPPVDHFKNTPAPRQNMSGMWMRLPEKPAKLAKHYKACCFAQNTELSSFVNNFCASGFMLYCTFCHHNVD